MAEPLILCPCSLAFHVLDVDGPSGTQTAYVCEHCDDVCDDGPRCALCQTLSRASTAEPG